MAQLPEARIEIEEPVEVVFRKPPHTQATAQTWLNNSVHAVRPYILIENTTRGFVYAVHNRLRYHDLHPVMIPPGNEIIIMGSIFRRMGRT